MGYIWQKVWDIFAKTKGYFRKNYRIYLAQKLWIYWAKTIGYIMGCIWQQLWDIYIILNVLLVGSGTSYPTY